MKVFIGAFDMVKFWAFASLCLLDRATHFHPPAATGQKLADPLRKSHAAMKVGNASR